MNMAFLSGFDLYTRESIVSVLIFAGWILAAYIVSFVWRSVFIPLARKTRTDLDRILLEETGSGVHVFLVALGFYYVVNRLVSLGMPVSFTAKMLTSAAYVALVFSTVILAAAFFRGFFQWYLKDVAHKTSTAFDEDFVRLLRSIIRIVLYFIAVTIVLSHFNVNISGFLATAGVASLAVALAAQETLANTIAGFMLILDRPFRVGDWIQLESGEMGFVREVGLRTTRILSFDNTLMIVPNAQIAKGKIVNRNYPDTRIKVRKKITVAYGSDMNKVKTILLSVCRDHRDVLKDPPPAAFFSEFGESALELLLIYWVADLMEQFRINDEINMEIKKRFEEENVEIPFPQHDVHLRGGSHG